MKVVPIAWTVVDLAMLEALVPYDTRAANLGSPDDLAEFAGRNCYLSWHRPNPATATNKGYLSNIINQEHFSVLEHGSVTFYIDGVSRALLTELNTHRHLSRSVVSQRYVDANQLGIVQPPIIDELPDGDRRKVIDIIESSHESSLRDYNALVEIFSKDHKRKQAREAARAVLPNMTESPMVVTGNIHAWRDVLGKRHHVDADKEIKQFSKEVLRHLRHIAPNSVQDIPTEPYGSEDDPH